MPLLQRWIKQVGRDTRKEAFWIPGRPHSPLEGTRQGEPSQGHPLKRHHCPFSSKVLNSMEETFKVPGCGRCKYWASPRGIPPHLQSHPLPSPGYRQGCGQPWALWLTGLWIEKCHSTLGGWGGWPLIPRFTGLQVLDICSDVQLGGLPLKPLS